ncbi:phosphatase PAP2 family protein [Pantoea sp. Acro-835]|uniref:Phosphatase PAP2 family protein n=2 Tax=Candidatus Pantoea multigeneris TaxID=2608357 RepID=A0ABX0RDM2_9GAMM|nr:phosphatase PAP2 family protein [Pantoea multigeneris]
MVINKAVLITVLLVPCQLSAMSLGRFGDITQIAVPLKAIGFALYKNDAYGFGQAIEGAIYTSALTHALKCSVQRERPNGKNGSFPSGHTSAAAQGAAFLQYRYGVGYGMPAWLLTGVVGYSRVEGKHHYWSDVAAGAALAAGVQYLVTREEINLSQFIVIPQWSDKYSGIQLSFRY